MSRLQEKYNFIMEEMNKPKCKAGAEAGESQKIEVFLHVSRKKKTCRKKPLWTDQGNIGSCSFTFPHRLEVGSCLYLFLTGSWVWVCVVICYVTALSGSVRDLNGKPFS